MSDLQDNIGISEAIISNMLEGVNLVRASDEIIVYTNSKFEEMLGYDHNELIGKHISIVNAATEKSPEETSTEITEYIKKNRVWQGETQKVKKDGTLFWFDSSVSSFDHPEHGKVFLSVHTDITKHKKAEEQLSIFKKFAENSSLGYSFSDLDGNVIYVNSYLCRMLDEKEPTNALGKNIAYYYPVNSRPLLLDEVLPTVKSKGSWIGELPLMSINGDITPTVHNISLIYDDEDKPVYLGCVITDITERKKAENQLLESEKKYKSLFEYAGDALFIMDVSEEHGTRFLECNDRTLKLFGCTHRDQIIGKTPIDFSPLKQPDGQSSSEKARELVRDVIKGHPRCFEWMHHRLDGTPLWVEVTLNRIEFKWGIFLQAVVRDITDRRKAEKELKKRTKDLERINRAFVGRELKMKELKVMINELKRGDDK